VTFCDNLALPAALADVLGVIDQERPLADSVPVTTACGFVDTPMMTRLYVCGRFTTEAQHVIPLEAALDGDAVNATSAIVETTTALTTLATCATGHRNKAFTSPTVPSSPVFRFAGPSACCLIPVHSRELLIGSRKIPRRVRMNFVAVDA
jgi:hypothetical protein